MGLSTTITNNTDVPTACSMLAAHACAVRLPATRSKIAPYDAAMSPAMDGSKGVGIGKARLWGKADIVTGPSLHGAKGGAEERRG